MRKGGDAGVLFELLESLADGCGNVGAGFEVDFFESFGIKGAMDLDFGSTLDERLDLGLPLFRSNESGRGEHGEDFFGRASGLQEFVQRAACGNAFAAFAGKNEETAVFEDSGASAHAFDALVEVEVKGIAAVGGEDNIEGSGNGLHGGLLDELAAFLVRLDEVAGEDGSDLSGFVECDVEEETGTGAKGDIAQFFPQGIAVGDAKGGFWVANVFFSVVAHDGLEAGDAGHDAFGTAAKSGEEVGFDETGDDAQVGFDGQFVDKSGSAVSGLAKLGKGADVSAVVVDDAVVADNFRREHLAEFFACVGAMGAELVEEGDVFARMVFQVFEDPRENAFVWSGASDVGKEDAEAVAGTDALLERRGGNGVLQGIFDGGALIRQAGHVGGADDGGL